MQNKKIKKFIEYDNYTSSKQKLEHDYIKKLIYQLKNDTTWRQVEDDSYFVDIDKELKFIFKKPFYKNTKIFIVLINSISYLKALVYFEDKSLKYLDGQEVFLIGDLLDDMNPYIEKEIKEIEKRFFPYLRAKEKFIDEKELKQNLLYVLDPGYGFDYDIEFGYLPALNTDYYNVINNINVYNYNNKFNKVGYLIHGGYKEGKRAELIDQIMDIKSFSNFYKYKVDYYLHTEESFNERFFIISIYLPVSRFK